MLFHVPCSILLNKECLVNWWSMWFGSHFTKPKMQSPLYLRQKWFTVAFCVENFAALTILLSFDLCFFHVDRVDWLNLNCLHSSTAFTPQSSLPIISIFSLMVWSVCWHLGFEGDILKCNACIISNAFISHVKAVNTKDNRYIKECIYFSKHMITLLIQSKTTYSTWKMLTVASFFHSK